MRNVLIGIFILLSGIVLGAGLLITFPIKNNNSMPSVPCKDNYRFINSQLGCKSTIVINKQEYTAFTSTLREYINSEIDQKKAKQISVYFRDLNNGPTFGINEKEKFIPASLLKLPLLVAYLNLMDDNKQLLETKITYKSSVPLNAIQSTDNIPQLENGKEYTVDNLLSRMIVYSDNEAEATLRNYLLENYRDSNPLMQTMTDIGLVDPKDPTESTLTVKSYASLFRQLYNSSYLSMDMSEKALLLLSQSQYNKGIVAGVPSKIKVAHKFGERGFEDNDQKQLHDCGIVYYPGNPYLICIMTVGNNFDDLSNVIKTISEKVYKEVDSRKY